MWVSWRTQSRRRARAACRWRRSVLRTGRSSRSRSTAERWRRRVRAAAAARTHHARAQHMSMMKDMAIKIRRRKVRGARRTCVRGSRARGCAGSCAIGRAAQESIAALPTEAFKLEACTVWNAYVPMHRGLPTLTPPHLGTRACARVRACVRGRVVGVGGGADARGVEGVDWSGAMVPHHIGVQDVDKGAFVAVADAGRCGCAWPPRRRG